MKSIDLKSKVSSLETLADNIERLGTNIIQQAPINYGLDEETGYDYYFWETISAELNLLQREVIRQYQSWYTQAFELIKRYLSPDRSSEFGKYYSSGRVTKTGILNYLQFTCTATNKDRLLRDFKSDFFFQRCILLTLPDVADVLPALISRKVFIVHGHDTEARATVARFIQQLDLQPVILDEQPNEGKTIIEKFEIYSDVGFAVVLLTPDDLGTSRNKPQDLKPRARQNVILELGYFVAKLGRSGVCALYKGGIEIPSDYHGVLYLSMDTHDWQPKLAKEIKQVIENIDMNKL